MKDLKNLSYIDIIINKKNKVELDFIINFFSFRYIK